MPLSSAVLGSYERPLRVAIIGAGPAGFYAAGALQTKGKELGFYSSVDMFERLIAPHGLVRYGVAPDHEKIKAVVKVFDKIAAHPAFRYFGNVEFGKDICHDELLTFYDAILYATGSPSDRRLGIVGEDLANSFSATEFVAWYNSHPDYSEFHPDLNVKSAVVVGVGNVAMDVARILASSVAELQTTDIADHALAALAHSQVQDIYILARRGPAQVKFTPIEIKEFAELATAHPIVRATELELDPESARLIAEDHEAQRNLAELQILAASPISDKPRRVHFRFLLSPLAVLAGDDGKMEALRCEKNRLVLNEAGTDMKAVGTGEMEVIPAGLLLRSVGYKGVALPDVPFDAKSGIIPNQAGRVLNQRGEVVAREYVAGWAKRGPTGVIGTNRPDAVGTVNHLLADVAQLTPASNPNPQAIVDRLSERGVRFVTLPGWEKIQAIEMGRGQLHGQPRRKIVDRQEMLGLL